MIQVLLSTYNGERYLGAQLDSVLAQDVSGLSVLVRDDGSRDNTVALLERYAAKHSSIQLLRGENIGFAHSFMRLLEGSSAAAQYIAFCDQDDVWLPGKLSRGIDALRRSAESLPALYCSRLAVVDERLSRLGFSRIPRRGLSFQNALVENGIAGCTMLLNQSARQVLLRAMPETLIAHDWWVYLIVSAFGTVSYDPEVRILYRQHGSNVFGLRLGSVRRSLYKIRRYRRIGRFQPVVTQAEELDRLYGSSLPETSRGVLQRFVRGCRRKPFGRLRYACSGEVYRQSATDNLVLKALITFHRL